MRSSLLFLMNGRFWPVSSGSFMSRALPLPLLLLFASPPARAEAVLDVSGSVVSVDPRLEVRVVVRNRGDRPAAPLEVAGELLGERSEARLADGVRPGAEGAILLAFTPTAPRPGVHALTLLLEHPVEGLPDGAGNLPVVSQRAWLLLALGANPPPAVRLVPGALRLDVRGDLPLRVESADGLPHRVRVRAVAARGLRAEGEGAEVAVAARRPAAVALPLVRAGAPRGSRHAVLLVSETLDGPAARADVLPATVDVAEDPALLPRLRTPVLALGLALVAFALAFEAWRRLRA
jgi:hypothetical protein